MTNPVIKPFENDSEAVSIKDITIENGTSVISIYGNMPILKDKKSLDDLKVLQANIDAIITALESNESLPLEAEDILEEGGEVDNPFV